MYLPSSTYRIQLNDHFTLRDLGAILPYLQSLGISTIYAAPLTTAIKGSRHGYDVTDPLVLNPEIGTEEEWNQVINECKRAGIGWIQDIVPNHMAYSTSNPWLYDVLQRGRDSRYYTRFDILTDHPDELLGRRLMAPFLNKPLTECLQSGELSLQFTPRGFVIRYVDKDFPLAVRLYHRLLNITEGCPSISARVAFVNQRIHLLESLLQDQPYVLANYRLTSSHINYRRFFTVDSLICLSMEKEPVFDAWHETLHRWYANGWIDGLRVDHIDGLADPKKYLQRLRERFGTNCYVTIEKILSRGETLPDDWPIQGTTGYDFLADVNQLLTDADGSRELLTFYRERIADLPPYDELVFQRKHNYLVRNMGGEWNNLMDLLMSLPSVQAGDQDKARLKQALGAWMASFPTYRAYPDDHGMSAADREMFITALTHARQWRPDLRREMNFLGDLFEAPGSAPTDEQRLAFLRRLMQFTGPLAAKGIEDTVFYIYNPYISHCEVGDSPANAGIDGQEFHRRMRTRQANFPHSLNATTTHDTKRGEDARIRLNYLSAIPRDWISAIGRWWPVNRPYAAEVNGRPAPSPNDEYLIYQALLGAWPEDGAISDSFRERFAGYLTKALREGDTETHYNDPDEAYESHCQAFVTAILKNDSPFLAEFLPFARDVIRRSSVYSLSQLLLKITAPGIPDIYQGTGGWETSLVDPDNRRAVDYEARIALLAGLKQVEADGPMAACIHARNNAQKGAEKLYTLYRSLAIRNRLPQVFADGEYIPLPAEGPLLAFLRHQGDDWALVAVPLIRYETPFPSSVSISLPPGAPDCWIDAFTGETLHPAAPQTASHPAGRTLTWPQGLSTWPVVLATAQ